VASSSQTSKIGDLRLGTRGSLLARAQSQWVAEQVTQRTGTAVELVVFKTTGDQIADRPLHEIGGKGLFTKELEQALLAGQIDFAVHSFKDVPVTMPLVPQAQAELVVAAVPTREDPRDALVSPTARRLADLPAGARIGTGSLRRRCQILHRRPDLIVEPVRGNLDTRLRKLREGQFDAIILAMAGLRRSALWDEQGGGMTPIEPDEMLAAAGQGALCLQCRRDDQRTRDLLAMLDDTASRTCVDAERAVVAGLNGDCHSPIAALATINGQTLTLHAAVGAAGGEPPVVSAVAHGSLAQINTIVTHVLDDLKARGALSLLGR
jgi:hydroxymethylbilane synthase